MSAARADVVIFDGGTIHCFAGRTPRGRTYIARNLQPEPWQQTAHGCAVEPRYAQDICGRMLDDGLRVSLRVGRRLRPLMLGPTA